MAAESEPEKIVEVVSTNAIALDPAKTYLIVMDSAAVSHEQGQLVLDELKALGINATATLLTDGDAFTSVQVIEVN
jgi:hypothetical protein